jgi:hypothetical protein
MILQKYIVDLVMILMVDTVIYCCNWLFYNSCFKAYL